MTEYLQLTDGTRWRVAGGLSVERETETFTVENARHPDISWKHTDSHGHKHRYVRDEEEVPRLPTLEARRRPVECDGSCYGGECDGYTVEEWFCRECGEQVEPGFRVVHDVTIPYATVSTYTIEVEAPPIDGPIEGAEYTRVDAAGNLNVYPLPPMYCGNSETTFGGRERTVTRTRLSGERHTSVTRKPVGP